MAAAQMELRTKLMRVAGLSAAAMVAACRAEGPSSSPPRPRG